MRLRWSEVPRIETFRPPDDKRCQNLAEFIRMIIYFTR